MCRYFPELPYSFLWTQFCGIVNLWTHGHLLYLVKGIKILHLISYSCFLIKHLSVLPDRKGRNNVLITNIWSKVKSMFCHTAWKGYNIVD